jgi:hypothetical protein
MTTPTVSPPALTLLHQPRGTTARFDMAQPAGRAGARRMLQRLSRAPWPTAETIRHAQERDRRLAALRRAQARVGVKLLSGEEWGREIAAETAVENAR